MLEIKKLRFFVFFSSLFEPVIIISIFILSVWRSVQFDCNSIGVRFDQNFRFDFSIWKFRYGFYRTDRMHTPNCYAASNHSELIRFELIESIILHILNHIHCKFDLSNLSVFKVKVAFLDCTSLHKNYSNY